MSNHPPAHAGLRHVALYVEDLEKCVTFYTEVFGMDVEWQPDADNVFLTSGNDNLALHRAASRTEQLVQVKVVLLPIARQQISEQIARLLSVCQTLRHGRRLCRLALRLRCHRRHRRA